MDIFLAALWLSLTLVLTMNCLIYRKLSKFSEATYKALSPLLFFHLTGCVLNTGLHVALLLPVVAQHWINPTSMVWHADPFVCRTFTAISNFLVTTLTCSLAAIFTERLKKSKEDMFNPWMFHLTVYLSISGLLASVLYSVLIPLISSGYIIRGVPNCPANVGVIIKTPAIGFLIITNNICMAGVFLHSHHGNAGGLLSLKCGIPKVWHVIANIISGCTIWLGVACLPLFLIGFSLVSPLYNTTRLYLTALTLASNSSTAILYEDILLNDTKERNKGDKEGSFNTNC